jgi:hypothetical protein
MNIRRLLTVSPLISIGASSVFDPISSLARSLTDERKLSLW